MAEDFNKKLDDNRVVINRESYLELKKLCQEAEIRGDMQFKFQGNDLLVKYAKYLIEFLDRKFEEHPKAKRAREEEEGDAFSDYGI
jgi:hypothetical protein